MSIYSSYIWLSATGNIGSWHRGSNEEVLSQVPQKPRPWEWANSRLPAGVGSSALAAGTRASPRHPPMLQLCPPWPPEGAQHLHSARPPASRGPLTIEALHLWLLALWLLLKPLCLAALLAVEHEAQDGNDVGHGGAHRQPNGLDHLVGGRAARALGLLLRGLVLRDTQRGLCRVLKQTQPASLPAPPRPTHMTTSQTLDGLVKPERPGRVATGFNQGCLQALLRPQGAIPWLTASEHQARGTNDYHACRGTTSPHRVLTRFFRDWTRGRALESSI